MDLIEQAKKAREEVKKIRTAVGQLDKDTPIRLKLSSDVQGFFYVKVESAKTGDILSSKDFYIYKEANTFFQKLMKKHKLVEE